MRAHYNFSLPGYVSRAVPRHHAGGFERLKAEIERIVPIAGSIRLLSCHKWW